jgi:SGS domain/CS domain
MSKPFSWSQTESHVTIVFPVDSNSFKKPDIEFGEKELAVSLEFKHTEKQFSFDLFGKIKPSESSFAVDLENVTPGESNSSSSQATVRITLVKDAEKGDSEQCKYWPFLTRTESMKSSSNYPTSNPVKKDWSKIDLLCDSNLKASKDKGEAALDSFFSQIYKGADEDARRAMIKSFQTSGGTVLSTNWNEVKEKDYEGKDRLDPPAGQQWAKQ